MWALLPNDDKIIQGLFTAKKRAKKSTEHAPPCIYCISTYFTNDYLKVCFM